MSKAVDKSLYVLLPHDRDYHNEDNQGSKEKVTKVAVAAVQAAPSLPPSAAAAKPTSVIKSGTPSSNPRQPLLGGVASGDREQPSLSASPASSYVPPSSMDSTPSIAERQAQKAVQSAALEQAPSSDLETARRLEEEADELISRERWEEAGPKYQQALALFKQFYAGEPYKGNHSEMRKILRKTGNCLMHNKKFPEALDCALQALHGAESLAKRPEDQRAVIKILHVIGICYFKMEDCQIAVAYFVTANKKARDTYGRYDTVLANGLDQLGQTYHQMKEYAKAQECFLGAIEIMDARIRIKKDKATEYEHRQRRVYAEHAVSGLEGLPDNNARFAMIQPLLERLSSTLKMSDPLCVRLSKLDTSQQCVIM